MIMRRATTIGALALVGLAAVYVTAMALRPAMSPQDQLRALAAQLKDHDWAKEKRAQHAEQPEDRSEDRCSRLLARACESLKMRTVDVHIVDLDAIVRGEYEENVQRKDFTASEAVAVKRALEPLEKAAAKERQRAAGGSKPGKRGGGGNRLGQIATSDKGKAADKAAKATRKSRRSLEKAEAVVVAGARRGENGKGGPFPTIVCRKSGRFSNPRISAAARGQQSY